ncbi:MAG: RluA family pseudouridine synthase [Elainellaceae cyanobacterium]
MTQVHLQVEASQEASEVGSSSTKGDRLDRWLTDHLPALSRSRIQTLIETGQVAVNGQLCTRKKQTVQVGDRLSLTLPDQPQPLDLKPEAIPLDILYEDDQLLIVNKPAGMVVHPAPGHPGGTLVNAVLAHCPTLAGIGGVQRPGIVHRIDKDTTGAIVVAKTDVAMLHLQAQMKAKTAQREYLAMVHGAPTALTGTVDQPIGRHPNERKKMAIVSEEKWGRRAVTHWQVEERLGNYTLMGFRLETGRTHQIRVHCAYLNHPIVGDPVYSSGHSVGVNLTGQALHAWRLRLRHPLSEEWIEAIAPLPETFSRLVRVLRLRCQGTPSSHPIFSAAANLGGNE